MNNICYAEKDHQQYLKFEGEIRIVWVDALQEWWEDHIKPGVLLNIDLTACRVLDSTMLGTLVLLHHRAQQVMVQFALLDSQLRYYSALGLTNLGLIQTTPLEAPLLQWQPLSKKTLDKIKGCKKVQAAHQALSSLKEGNLSLFRDLMRSLSKPQE